MLETNQEIIKSMDQTIFKENYSITEYILDLNIDDLVDSEIMEILPVLRAINAAYKGILGVRDRFFIKKIILFINQFNSGLDTPEIQRFVSDILIDDKFRERVTEKIIIFLDRFDDEFKALILAELLKNWVKQNIDWSTFKKLSYSIDRTHPILFIGLYDYYKNFKSPDSTCGEKMGGGFYRMFKPLMVASGFGNITGGAVDLIEHQDAIDICQYGLKELLDDQYEILPDNIICFLRKEQNKPGLLVNDPFFSDYEKWLIDTASIPGCHYKIRKEIIDKIRKRYSI